jgi:hypothetical protein
MRKVIACYPSDGSPERSELNIQFNEVPPEVATDDLRACDWAWAYLQRHDEESVVRMNDVARSIGVSSIRSSMVGDLYTVQLLNDEGQKLAENYYIVDGIGFKQIEASAVENWKKLPSTDRLMGLEWCLKKVLNKLGKFN